MEGLRILGQSRLDQTPLHFHEPTLPFRAISINSDAAGSQKRYREFAILPHMFSADALGNSTESSANLLLLNIRRNKYDALTISPTCFYDIFTTFNLEPYILSLMANMCYGFHHFPPYDAVGKVKTHSFHLGTILFMLVWSFDPRTLATRAILLPRRDNGLHDGDVAYAQFASLLRSCAENVVSPLFLSFVANLQIHQWLDDYVCTVLKIICDIEARTGYGGWKSSTKHRLSIHEITEISKTIAHRLGTLANLGRHHGIATSLETYLENFESYPCQIEISSIVHQQQHDRVKEKYRSMLPILRRKPASIISYIQYLQERVRSQALVVRAYCTFRCIWDFDLSRPAEQSSHARRRSRQY